MKILAVVPARGGSKGVPRKNLREVGGRPLIAHVLEAAAAAEGIDELIVSTDSAEIAEEALRRGASVPFLRPPELGGDEVPLIAVARHALLARDGGAPFDAVLSLQPTAPLLSSGSITRAIRLFREGGWDAVVSVTAIRRHHPFRAYALAGEALAPLTEHTTERFLQRQDRPPAYGMTGGLYLRRRALLEAWEGRGFALGDRVGAVVLDEEEALDIDTEIDLIVLDALLRRRAGRGRAGGGGTDE